MLPYTLLLDFLLLLLYEFSELLLRSLFFFVAFNSYLICVLCCLILLKTRIGDSLEFSFAPYLVFSSGFLLLPLGCSAAFGVGGSSQCVMSLGSQLG